MESAEREERKTGRASEYMYWEAVTKVTELRPGDILVYPANPGHVMIVMSELEGDA